MDFSKYLGLEVGWQFLFFFNLVFEFLDVVAIVAIENLFEDETKKYLVRSFLHHRCFFFIRNLLVNVPVLKPVLKRNRKKFQREVGRGGHKIEFCAPDHT